MDSFELSLERLNARQMNFLQNASPDDWHRYAWHHNWDERLDGLFWIVSQPQCDRATALLIFWKGEPTGYDYEIEEERMGEDIYAVAPMLRHIAERFNTTGFSRSEIAYDFQKDHGLNMPEHEAAYRSGRMRDIEELIGRQKSLIDPNLKLHPDMKLLHIPGRKVGGYDDESDFYDLFPEDLDDQGSGNGSAVATSQPNDKELDKPESRNDVNVSSEADASARIRAIRRQVEVTIEDDSVTKTASGLLNWLKRPFER